MYRPGADPDAAAHFGMTVAEMDGPPYGVFSDNWRTANLFASLQTQWRVGLGGATGLDYVVLYHRMDRMGLTPDEYADLEDEIMTMESVALKTMREFARG